MLGHARWILMLDNTHEFTFRAHTSWRRSIITTTACIAPESKQEDCNAKPMSSARMRLQQLLPECARYHGTVLHTDRCRGMSGAMLETAQDD